MKTYVITRWELGQDCRDDQPFFYGPYLSEREAKIRKKVLQKEVQDYDDYGWNISEHEAEVLPDGRIVLGYTRTNPGLIFLNFVYVNDKGEITRDDYFTCWCM